MFMYISWSSLTALALSYWAFPRMLIWFRQLQHLNHQEQTRTHLYIGCVQQRQGPVCCTDKALKSMVIIRDLTATTIRHVQTGM